MFHYANLLRAGFNLDYNEFTLEEQDLISFVQLEINNLNKENESKMWTKFLKRGFEAVCKTIAKRGV